VLASQLNGHVGLAVLVVVAFYVVDKAIGLENVLTQGKKAWMLEVVDAFDAEN
jgi:hypothetical protein